MNAIAKTRELLTRTESELAQLAAEASTQREYETAGRVLATAQAVKKLIEQYASSAQHDSSPTNGNSSIATLPSEGQARRVRSTPSGRKKNRLDMYPRFFKSNDRLVKVGWSKKDKAEYEHKCPRVVLSSLVEAFMGIRGVDKRFSMDEVLPLVDPTDGSELPTYQIYVALAWLKSLGLIEQHGRQGYSIRKGMDIRAEVESSWNSLP